MAAAVALGIAGAIEALTGIGATTASTVALATGSEAVGGLAGTAVVGTSANQVTEFILGEEGSKKLETIVQDVNDAYFALQNSDPRLIINRRTNRLIEENKNQAQAVKNPFDVSLDPPSDLDKDDQQHSAFGNNKVLNSDIEIDGKIQNYDARDIVEVVNFVSKRAANEQSADIPKFLKEMSNVDDYYKPITESITDYLNNNATTNSAEYKSIASIYNMDGVSIENNFIAEPTIDGRFNLYFIDETGVKNGPMLSGKKGDNHLPSVYKTYGGPQSINDKAPENIVDLVFAAHDIDFSVNGYFDFRSDLKLISRLNALLDKGLVPKEDVGLIKSIVTYFSTAGVLVDSLKGSNTRIGQDNLDILPQDNDGIFSIANPNAINLDDENYKFERFKFYNDLDEAFAESMSSMSSIADVSKIGRIQNELENMRIIIV